jgi:hypothetical protein
MCSARQETINNIWQGLCDSEIRKRTRDCRHLLEWLPKKLCAMVDANGERIDY